MQREVKILILSGICLEALFLSIALFGNLRKHVIAFIALDLTAFLPYVWCLYHFHRTKLSDQLSRKLLKLIIFFAVLFRITLIFSVPSLSDDIYRYLWDGKLLNHGINPYRYAPGANSQEILALHDSDFALINHKDIGTIYGPVLVMIFALAEKISSTVFSMKFAVILFDFGIIYLIILMLKQYNFSSLRVLTYAWNPLVIVEIAGSGHNDPLSIFFLLTAIYFWNNKKNTLSIVTASLSMFSKYLSLFLLPFYLKKTRGKVLIIFFATAALIYGPFHSSLENYFLSIFSSGSAWRFNDSVFFALFYITQSILITKIIVISIFVVFLGWVLVKDWDIIKYSFVLIGAALMLTTTLHPWYLLWIIPFLCFYPNTAWLLLTALVSISYHVLIGYDLTGSWDENNWIRFFEYMPFYVMLIYGFFSQRRNNCIVFSDYLLKQENTSR